MEHNDTLAAVQETPQPGAQPKVSGATLIEG